MIVQIYEIQTPQEAAKCIEAGVDHIGSVLSSEEEWRQPLLKEAVQLSEAAGIKNSLIPLSTFIFATASPITLVKKEIRRS